MITSNKFFSELFSTTPINFRCIKSGVKPIDSIGTYEEASSSLEDANKMNYEIYFVVNSGGYKDAEITKFNAVFLDFDCGRNEFREYHSLEKTSEFKQMKIEELQKFKYKPSIVIETRNGLHVYWLLDGCSTIEQFRECEEKLISYFDADKNVKNPARLMRVPHFYWCKDVNNKFFSNILQFNDVRYEIDDLIFTLSRSLTNSNLSYQEGLRNSNKKEYKKNKIITDPKTPMLHHSTNIQTITNRLQLIRNRISEVLKEQINADSECFQTHGDVYDYLKRQDLRSFLGLHGKTFSCLFHKDEKPSAGIIISPENGHQIYNCFSNNCDFKKGTIIQITERLTNLSRYKALKFLRTIFNIGFFETEWQKEQKEIFEENQRFLVSDDFKEFYPEVYGRMKNYITVLYILNGLARDSVVTENFTTDTGTPIFFASNSYLSNLFRKDDQFTSKVVSYFAFLGLINKHRDDDVPDFLMERAKHEAARKRQIHTVNFFSIDAYGDEILSFSKMKSLEFSDKQLTMRGFGREILLRTWGEDEANRVFPKITGKQLSKSSVRLSSEIEQVTNSLIQNKGWTTEKEIISLLTGIESIHVREKQMKKVLPEMLDKYGLVRIRADKTIKLLIKANISGYPYLICKPSSVEGIV